MVLQQGTSWSFLMTLSNTRKTGYTWLNSLIFNCFKLIQVKQSVKSCSNLLSSFEFQLVYDAMQYVQVSFFDQYSSVQCGRVLCSTVLQSIYLDSTVLYFWVIIQMIGPQQLGVSDLGRRIVFGSEMDPVIEDPVVLNKSR